MHARELFQLLSTLSGSPLGEIDQRTRLLREQNFISSGGRGRNAPLLQSAEVAYVLACMAARRATDGVKIGVQLAELELVVTRPEVQTEGFQLAAALTGAVERGEEFASRIEMAADGSYAWVTFNHMAEGAVRWLFEERKAVAAKPAGRLVAKRELDDKACGHVFVLGANAIQSVHVRYHQAHRAAVRTAEEMAGGAVG